MNQPFDLDSFDKHSKQTWIEQVIRELDGVIPFEKLKWKHDEKIEIAPIYFREDLEFENSPISRPSLDNQWANMLTVALPLSS